MKLIHSYDVVGMKLIHSYDVVGMKLIHSYDVVGMKLIHSYDVVGMRLIHSYDVVGMRLIPVASEAYHDWSGEAAGARLRVNFTLKLLLSQNFCNRQFHKFCFQHWSRDRGTCRTGSGAPEFTVMM